MVDGELRRAGVRPQGRDHAILIEVEDGHSVETRLVLGPERRRESDGVVVREVVVDGWRVEVELEPERRASLRERARRASDVAGRSGPVEVHAIIPGRIVALSVAPGDAVVAGQQLLVLEAMKMQNELRAPREGSIERIPIAVGENVEVGDLLMVIS
jgi:biotin carboxyl carrier protein